MADSNSQIEVLTTPRGRVMAMDSAYHVSDANRDRDVVVAASYCGVLPARFIAQHRLRDRTRGCFHRGTVVPRGAEHSRRRG
jgi:hypothetical protein